MDIWLPITVAGLTSFLLRIGPFLLGNLASNIKDDGPFFQYLNYCISAVIGCIIYSVAFNNHNSSEFIKNFNYEILLRICIIVLVFIVNVKLKRSLVSFMIGFLSYAVITWLIITIS